MKMRIIGKWWVWSVVIAVVLGQTACAGLVPVQISEKREKRLELDNPSVLAMLENGEEKRVTVGLWEIETKVKFKCDDGAYRTKPMRCYELRSLDDEIEYTYVTWSNYRAGNFRLFCYGSGKNYLSWVEGHSVHFAEISKPKEKVEQLRKKAKSPGHLFTPDVVDVPVHELISDVFNWGEGHTYYVNIPVQSIRKDFVGGWTVKIANPEYTTIYTIRSSSRAQCGWVLI